MRLLNSLNKQLNLTEHTKLYIARYKTLYKRVIREAKGEIMITIYCMHKTNLKPYGGQYTRKLGKLHHKTEIL